MSESNSEFEETRGASREAEIVYQAAVESLGRTRRALIVLSTVICIGYFHLYEWYGSWNGARVAARTGVVAVLKGEVPASSCKPGRFLGDKDVIARLEKEIAELRAKQVDAMFTVPLAGMVVPVGDMSVGISLVALSLTVWLLFFQRKVNACLKHLDRLQGWKVPMRVLEFHFTLIGSHATMSMRVASKALLLSFPTMTLLFLASDLWDLWVIKQTELQCLSFSYNPYLRYVTGRLCVGVILAILSVVVTVMCYREYRTAEDELLKFAKE